MECYSRANQIRRTMIAPVRVGAAKLAQTVHRGSYRFSFLNDVDGRRLEASVISCRCGRIEACQGLGRVFVEQLMIVAGEPSGIQESLLHRYVRNRRGRRIAVPQNGMDAAKPAAAEKGDGSDADGVVKSAVQRSP